MLGIIGLLAAAGFGRLGVNTLHNLDAEGYAHRLALDLRQARACAMASGDDHCVALDTTNSLFVGWQVERALGNGSWSAADEPHDLPAGGGVSAQILHNAGSGGRLTFRFDGTPATPYHVRFSGDQSSWDVTVSRATGRVVVSRTAP